MHQNSSLDQPFTSRCDLHVHSKYSDRPSEWLLRRVGAPECFVEPMVVYERAMAAGMDFVTISDHNKIDGALEIAHLPNTFISDEVTTYFPENGAKMHILVTGITPAQFEIIQEVREDIYAFRDYVIRENILYAVAHPLFLVNEKLTIDQFERLLLLFNRFELINGTRDPRASRVVASVMGQMTPEFIERLADKHGIDPVGPNPHLKHFTGGSDDHSGLYVASAHTITPKARTVEEYLDHLRAGRHEAAGRSGSSVHLGHCFYHIAYHYYKAKFLRDPNGRESLLGEMLRRLLEPPAPKPSGATARIKGAIGGWLWHRHKNKMSPTERMLVDEFSTLFGTYQDRQRALQVGGMGSAPMGMGPSSADAFEISCRIAHQLGFMFLKRFLERASDGDLFESLQTLAAFGPVVAAITPYLAAFKTQHKDEQFIKKVSHHFDSAYGHRQRSERKAWLTDTFDEVNGVTRTIKMLAREASREGRPLTVLTSQPSMTGHDAGHVNFEPVGQFPMPEYAEQQVSFPPFMEVIEHIERRQYSELILSTPGPMGLTGLAAAKLMHLKTVGIYHTDFPTYVRCFTEDLAMEAMTWRYMSWFFEQCDTILVPSAFYQRQLTEHGFDPAKIGILRRGVDTQRFNPAKRNPGYWRQFGGRTMTTLMYCGRISSEKNITLLADAFEILTRNTPDVQLAIVGDGPLQSQLKKRFQHHDQVIMTGYLGGDELATAYASADVFVFPSTTDTFGNVVLEAQAAGLPAIVTDRGGPQEIIRRHDSGLLVDVSGTLSEQRAALVDAMRELLRDTDRRRELGQRALQNASEMSWSAILDTLWSANDGQPGPAADQIVKRDFVLD